MPLSYLLFLIPGGLFGIAFTLLFLRLCNDSMVRQYFTNEDFSEELSITNRAYKKTKREITKTTKTGGDPVKQSDEVTKVDPSDKVDSS